MLPLLLTTFETQEDQISYVIGYRMGQQVQTDIDSAGELDLNLDRDLMVAAFNAAVSGDSSVFSDDERNAVLASLRDTVQARGMRRASAEGDETNADSRRNLPDGRKRQQGRRPDDRKRPAVHRRRRRLGRFARQRRPR